MAKLKSENHKNKEIKFGRKLTEAGYIFERLFKLFLLTVQKSVEFF
jgi:hypothetical protein